MKKSKRKVKVLYAPRMEGENIAPAKRRKQWGVAFGQSALAQAKRREQWGFAFGQSALADYKILFRENKSRVGGSWGIYLRGYNVRVATFAPNSATIRATLARVFDAAHAIKVTA